MILVVNLNASIDKRYELSDLKKGEVMRARQVDNTPGGKGIHVANVATILGEDCLATGMLGGKAGEFIAEKLSEYGIKQDFVTISGETRSCLAMITDDGVQTEILEPGPEVSLEEQQQFLDKYQKLVKSAEIIVGSGSAPKNVPSTIYEQLIQIANQAGKKFFLDTSGELLEKGIAAQPYFIKPNKDEIEALTGRKISGLEDAVRELKAFAVSGVQIVAISLGAEGSIVGYKGKIYKVSLPKVKVVNPVGSGDAYVAGMAVAEKRNYPIIEAIGFASACGTANAMEKESGFVTAGVVEDLVKQITVEEI